MGLSSLGRIESCTLPGVEAVIAVLEALRGHGGADLPDAAVFEAGAGRLRETAEHLLGRAPQQRSVRIMVTLPTRAAVSPDFMRDLIAAGTDVVRINCAHDSEREWAQMVANVRSASQKLGKSCKVLMDLAGPKLRTGEIRHGCHVARLRVQKDNRGAVLAPAKVALVAGPAPPHIETGAVLHLSPAMVRAAEPGDKVCFRDSCDRKRKLTITAKHGDSCIATCGKGAYILNGARMTLVRDGDVIASARVHDLPFVEEPVRLQPKDMLLVADEQLAPEALRSLARRHTLPHISCTLPEAFSSARVSDPIFFDDGAVEGVIRETHPDHMIVEIVRTGPGGAKLGSAKGINLPVTELPLCAITEKDRRDLDFVVEHADIVGLSFVRRPEDVLELESELAKRDKGNLGVILKIETRQAFEHLPMILLAALRHDPVGVMVARGDLAIETGFDRLAEVQEEILWLSEAAHLPVIWATQVLEGMVKTGTPSRAEVTDAAMSVQAECVMLNKGDHIIEAVHFLDNILQRMQAHQRKKRSMLRHLHVADIRHA